MMLRPSATMLQMPIKVSTVRAYAPSTASGPAQQPLRANQNQKHEKQHGDALSRERHRRVGRQDRLGDREKKRSQYRSDEATKPADHDERETLVGNHVAHVGIHGVVKDADHDAAEGRNRRADEEDTAHAARDIDAHHLGRFEILRRRADFKAELRLLEEEPEQHENAGRPGQNYRINPGNYEAPKFVAAAQGRQLECELIWPGDDAKYVGKADQQPHARYQRDNARARQQGTIDEALDERAQDAGQRHGADQRARKAA